jgi:hypothetical protein
MLVSTIISKGLSYAALPATNFFTAQDQLDAVQQGWEEIYSALCKGNSDYFVMTVYPTLSAFTPDANRQFLYNYALPSDFFHLRLFQYQNNAQTFQPIEKMTIENFGNTQAQLGYRLVGTNLALYTITPYTNFCIWYYPVAATLSTSTDLTYPQTVIFEILAWDVAIEARRKQNLDFTDKLQKKMDLWNSMMDQLPRDDNKPEPIKNVFAQGFWPYI